MNKPDIKFEDMHQILNLRMAVFKDMSKLNINKKVNEVMFTLSILLF